MGRRIWPHIRQHETHRELAGRPRPGARRGSGAALDAIIVPASRSAANLDHAVTVARAVGCSLVVFCSRDAHGAEVARLLTARCFTEAVVVDLPPDYAHPLLTFETSRFARTEQAKCFANPNGDLSAKRNLGLILAHMVGWDRIFFMDDDIRDLAPAHLSLTASMLDRYRSAGIRVDNFPDNSVVCHARRQVGDEQDVFVSGAALAVNCADPVSFFPEIYNEDWLFFYDDARDGKLGDSGCHATQLRYDPFGNRRRARQQEFGDILAEGLYSLLHDKKSGPGDATRDYWTDFIATRRRLLVDIKRRSGAVSPAVRRKMLSALDSATMSLATIQPQTCAKYVTIWRDDVDGWQKKLSEVPRGASIDAALDELGLDQVTDGVGAVTLARGHDEPVPSLRSGAGLIQGAPVGLFVGMGAFLTRPGHGRRRGF